MRPGSVGSAAERSGRIAIFQDLAGDRSRLEKVAARLETRRHRAGTEIIREGDEGDALFVLNSGKVRILRSTMSKERFALVNLSAEDDVFFGEIALVDSDRRSATVLALTDCETLALTRKSYLALCEEDPYIGFKITFRIACRLASSLRKSNADALTLYQALLEEIS